MRKALLYISALLILSASAVAQTRPVVDTIDNLTGIEIQTSVDRSEIYVGDLINYTITILYDSTYELIPPPLGANLGAFDVKDYQSDIITKLPDGRIKSENKFVLSTFTTGDYVIPPIPVVFNLPDSTRKALLSEAVPIKVLSLLANESDSVDIKPLKAQYEFQRDYTMYYIYGAIILVVLLVVAFFVIRRMRRVEEIVEPVDDRSPWEIAFEQLALLRQKPYVEEGLYKNYYIELSEILRSYHERIFALNVMDMTTEEFLEIFEQLDLPENLYGRTKMFLRHADLVKFAKYKPERERVGFDFEEVHQMIEIVRVEQERKKQTQISIASENGKEPKEDKTMREESV